jgi:hypothetical protein
MMTKRIGLDRLAMTAAQRVQSVFFLGRWAEPDRESDWVTSPPQCLQGRSIGTRSRGSCMVGISASDLERLD